MKKNLAVILFLCFIAFLAKKADASLFWNIDNGISEYRNGNYTFARDYFISYLNNNPNDKDGYYWLAMTYKKLKDKKATQTFKKSYELTSKEKTIEKISFEPADITGLEDYFDMAVMYYETEKYKEAEIYADLMLKISPKSSSAYFVKSKIAYTKGDTRKAKEYLNKAILLNNEILNTNLAKNLNITDIPRTTKEMYSSMAQEAYFYGDTDSAIKNAQKYLTIDSTNANMQNLLIDSYLKNNELDNAQKIVDLALNTNENNVDALLYEAKIKSKNNKPIEHILLNASKINPNNQQALLDLGNYYLNKKDFEKSKQYFETLINVNDELYEGYFGYIYSLIYLNEIEKASVYIRKAASLNPNSSEIAYLLGKICEYEAKYEDALDYYEQASQKDENPDYLLEAAKMEYILKNYVNSLSYLEDASNMPFDSISKDTIDEYILKNYIKLKNVQSAKNYLNKKLSLDKNRIIYKYILYDLYKLEGNKEKALVQYSQIKKIKPQQEIDYIDLSEFLAEQKGINSANKLIDEELKKFPNSFALKLQKTKLNYLSK